MYTTYIRMYYIRANVYIYVYIYMYTCIYIHMCVHVYIYVLVYMYIYIYLYICTYIFMYLHVFFVFSNVLKNMRTSRMREYLCIVRVCIQVCLTFLNYKYGAYICTCTPYIYENINGILTFVYVFHICTYALYICSVCTLDVWCRHKYTYTIYIRIYMVYIQICVIIYIYIYIYINIYI